MHIILTSLSSSKFISIFSDSLCRTGSLSDKSSSVGKNQEKQVGGRELEDFSWSCVCMVSTLVTWYLYFILVLSTLGKPVLPNHPLVPPFFFTEVYRKNRTMLTWAHNFIQTSHLLIPGNKFLLICRHLITLYAHLPWKRKTNQSLLSKNDINHLAFPTSSWDVTGTCFSLFLKHFPLFFPWLIHIHPSFLSLYIISSQKLWFPSPILTGSLLYNIFLRSVLLLNELYLTMHLIWWWHI